MEFRRDEEWDDDFSADYEADTDSETSIEDATLEILEEIEGLDTDNSAVVNIIDTDEEGDDQSSDDDSDIVPRVLHPRVFSLTNDFATQEASTACTLPETPRRTSSSVVTSTQSPLETCTICFEPWTNTSEHRVVSLKCGHIYGKTCIERWIRSANPHAKCPQCNAPANLRDVRCLYVKALAAVDTSELDMTKKQLEDERNRNLILEKQISTLKQRLQSASNECDRLKEELMLNNERLKSFLSTSKNKETLIKHQAKRLKITESEPFKHVRDIEINLDGGCRIVSYSNILDSIVVSQQSQHPLVKGFGIKKVSIHDFKTNEFILLHQKPIKDMVINQYDGTVLSCSFDKTVKLTSLSSRATHLVYSLDIEPWSVAFNPVNNNEFFVGLRNGKTLVYDTRVTSCFKEQFGSSSSTPVVSLNYIYYKSSKNHSVCGLLCAQLDNCTFYERPDSERIESFRPVPIIDRGRFTSSDFDPKSGYGLLSCRPSNHHQKVTHSLINFATFPRRNENEQSQSIMKKFEGGQTMVHLAKAKIFAHPGKESATLVCAGDESISGAFIWEAESGKCLQQLLTGEEKAPILDLCLMHDVQTDSHFLGALTDKRLRVYKYVL